MKKYTTIDLTGPAVIAAAPGQFTDFETVQITPASVLAAIGAARDADHRGILLTLDGLEGGIVSDCLDVYRALRDFSDAGGTVVAFVRGLCMSSGPWLALAADYVVIDEGARMVIHGAHEVGTRTPVRDNSEIAAIFAERSLASPVEVAGWLSKFVRAENRADKWADLSADESLDAGLADHVGDLASAEAVMAAALAGVLAPTPRQVHADASRRSGVVVNSIQSSDYLWSGVKGTASEVAVQGTRIRNNASAVGLPGIVTSPAGIKIGNKTLDQTWLNQARSFGAYIRGVAGSSLVTVLSSVGLGSPVAATLTGVGVISLYAGPTNAPVYFTFVGRLANGTTIVNRPVESFANTTAAGRLQFDTCSTLNGAIMGNLTNYGWEGMVQGMIGSGIF